MSMYLLECWYSQALHLCEFYIAVCQIIPILSENNIYLLSHQAQFSWVLCNSATKVLAKAGVSSGRRSFLQTY